MEFKIKTRKKEQIKKYEQKNLDVAYEFAKQAYKEFGKFLKAIILFGSSARRESTGGDIDILVIVDDVSVQFTPELIQTYRIIIEKIVLKISKKLHITTLKFTNFWEYIRAGDPVAVNILRDGVSLIDTGFFEPLQLLLYQGRIRPSQESIWVYFERAPRTLHNSKWHILQATLDLYWAVIDSAHAALMKLNEVPPSPSHVADMLEEKMVKTGLLDKKYPRIMRQFQHLSKMIIRNEVTGITGEQYDLYFKEAQEFVEVMQKFIKGK